ncbi:MAG: acidic tetraheme cytochrome c3 TmcA [Thermodesulfobacteriota bacterium]
MKRYAWITAALVAACLWAACPAFAQDDMTRVSDPAFTQRTRPLPLFPHDLHNEQAGIGDCGACHHVYENGVKSETETSEDRMCSDCHAKGNDTRLLRKAFHDRCKGCHEQEKKGPVQCAECHRKGR